MSKGERMKNRMKSIYLLIKKSNTPIAVSELAEEFGTSRRTISRDLKILEYNQLIVQVKKGNWTIS